MKNYGWTNKKYGVHFSASETKIVVSNSINVIRRLQQNFKKNILPNRPIQKNHLIKNIRSTVIPKTINSNLLSWSYSRYLKLQQANFVIKHNRKVILRLLNKFRRMDKLVWKIYVGVELHDKYMQHFHICYWIRILWITVTLSER